MPHACLIIYAKVKRLKAIFPATHQLIRAHIDYLLMFILLVVTYYLAKELSITLPLWVIALLCIGSLYNPFGFILLAIKPTLANPETRLQKLRALTGFFSPLQLAMVLR